MTRSLSRTLLFLILIGGTSSILGAACTQDDASTELASLADVEHGCVVSAACGVQPRAAVANCINYYFDVLIGLGQGPIYAQIYHCVREAGSDCAAVVRCFGETGNCTQSTFTAYCKGSRALTCDLLDRKVYALECGVAGLACHPLTQQPFAATCDCDASFAPRCHGTYAVTCSAGQPSVTNCAALGANCAGGQCVTRAPGTCDPKKATARCDGDIAITCNSEGKELREDCSARPLHRRCDKGSCQRTGTACADDFNRCSPSGDLEACVDGQWKTFPCAKLGLGDCRKALYGANCSRFN